MGTVRCIGCARAARSGSAPCPVCSLRLARVLAARVPARPRPRAARLLHGLWIVSGVLSALLLASERSAPVGLGLLLVAVTVCIVLARSSGPPRPRTATDDRSIELPLAAPSLPRLPRTR